MQLGAEEAQHSPVGIGVKVVLREDSAGPPQIPEEHRVSLGRGELPSLLPSCLLPFQRSVPGFGAQSLKVH